MADHHFIGLVNGAQGLIKKVWFNQGSNPQSHLPAVVFVKFNQWSGMFFIQLH
jgi:hypothetical protein